MKKLTYDVCFNDAENSNSLGLRVSFAVAKRYIKRYNGSNFSYFGAYVGGVVSIYCHETSTYVYQVNVKNRRILC